MGGTLEDDPQNKQRGAGRGRRTGKEGARSVLIPEGQGRGGRSFGCAVVSFFSFIWRVAWVLVVVFAPAFGCAVVSFVLMFGLSLGCWLWSLRPAQWRFRLSYWSAFAVTRSRGFGSIAFGLFGALCWSTHETK